MPPLPSDAEPRPPEDYARLLATMEPVLLVGGQAVNLWALYYQSHTAELAPFVSRDVDVLGDRETLTALGQIAGAKPQFFPVKPPTNEVGVVIANDCRPTAMSSPQSTEFSVEFTLHSETYLVPSSVHPTSSSGDAPPRTSRGEAVPTDSIASTPSPRSSCISCLCNFPVSAPPDRLLKLPRLLRHRPQACRERSPPVGVTHRGKHRQVPALKVELAIEQSQKLRQPRLKSASKGARAKVTAHREGEIEVFSSSDIKPAKAILAVEL